MKIFLEVVCGETERERKPTSLSHTSDVVADGYDVVEMIAKFKQIETTQL